VEDPSLPLDPSRENKDTDNTKGEQGENDPKGSVSSMGGVEESSLGLGLVHQPGEDRMPDQGEYTYPRTMGERQVMLGSTVMSVVTVMGVMGFTSSTGGTDGNG
jgi:hypothetical protein